MPWTSDDAIKKTKKANTPEKQKLWARTANSILESTGSESKAIRLANAAVRDHEGPAGDYREDHR